MTKKITEDELKSIQGLVNDFNQLKVQLGDTVISQNALMEKLSELKLSYAEKEQTLVDKYGKESVINIQTGEITDAPIKEE
tara:strand:+ start:1856 stop:2098 length:243 start_codon:yes stop_codon:yes gene_type:complete